MRKRPFQTKRKHTGYGAHCSQKSFTMQDLEKFTIKHKLGDTIFNSFSTLVQFAEQFCKFCEDAQGQVYVKFPRLGSLLAKDSKRYEYQVKPIECREFQRWLAYWQDDIDRREISDTIFELSTRVSQKQKPGRLYNRVAHLGSAIYIDLARGDGHVIKVTKKGWSIQAKCPVVFMTTGSPLPNPRRGASLEPLKTVLNVSEEDFALIRAWLIMAAWGKGPFPIAYLLGRHGSAKSMTSRFIRQVIDPSPAGIGDPPQSVHELNVTANQSWIVGIGNISKINGSMSDAFCRISTDGTSVVRRLFTDNQVQVLEINRPLLMNGIVLGTERPDFIDRCLVVRLPEITSENRQSQRDLEEKFEEIHPYVLGGLLDGLVSALRNINLVKIDRLPRLADVALVVTAAELGLKVTPGTFLRAAFKSSEIQALDTLEASPLGSFIHYELLSKKKQWVGRMIDLLKAAKASKKHPGTYSNEPRALTEVLNRIEKWTPIFGQAVNCVSGLSRHPLAG